MSLTGRPGRNRPIGPGRLVLVVGPSGAGKDTLIGLARAALRDDPRVAFPRRVITRPRSSFEDHDSLSAEDFDRAARAGAFALTWAAHGLEYGLPASIDGDIRAGRAVVCNVSRTIVEPARRRYAQVQVVAIAAPPPVLAARLSARGRGTDGSIKARLSRTAHVAAVEAEVVIANIGTPEAAAAELIAAIGGRINHK